MQTQVARCTIELVQGDITLQEVDAIVNAANAQLAGGGGVDGAIHAAAGPSVMEETRRRYPLGCPTGSAVASAAGDLSARYIFHTVGPVWRGGMQGERDLLQAAYRRCLELAVKHECRSLAIPAVSTGVYGYPMDLAAEDSLRAVREFLEQTVEQQSAASEHKLQLVRFVLFGEGAYGAFSRAMEALWG